MKKTSALVLFSGGQDSTTCLMWALNQFDEVRAMSFDYHQRHRREIDQAKKICKKFCIPLTLFKTDIFSNLSKNALTHKIPIRNFSHGLPSTFVPGRNLLFLSLAALNAYHRGVTDLVTGVCQTDFSGYPDCREAFIKSLEITLSLALDRPLRIHTPLMHLTKGQSILLMQRLGHFELFKETHTCYEGKYPACGKCPSCQLRLKGFQEIHLQDPLPYSP